MVQCSQGKSISLFTLFSHIITVYLVILYKPTFFSTSTIPFSLPVSLHFGSFTFPCSSFWGILGTYLWEKVCETLGLLLFVCFSLSETMTTNRAYIWEKQESGWLASYIYPEKVELREREKRTLSISTNILYYITSHQNVYQCVNRRISFSICYMHWRRRHDDDIFFAFLLGGFEEKLCRNKRKVKATFFYIPSLVLFLFTLDTHIY